MNFSTLTPQSLRSPLISALLATAALAMSPTVRASFQLETMTVILDAGEGRKTFSVKNMSQEPILLSTKVEDIPGDTPVARDILVSPPVIRIEPQESQQVNFVLKKGVTVTREQILKASFQGISATKANVAKMPIRQDIAMLVVPAGTVESQTPWDSMQVRQVGNRLILSNPGQQVIRMAPVFVTLPGNKSYSIGQFYLRPGESRTVEVGETVKEVKLSPLSRYGFKSAQDATLPVSR